MRSPQILTLSIVALLASGYWLLTPGQAQPGSSAAATRNVVAIVNVPELFRDSKQMKTMTDDFNTRLKQLQANADKQQQSLTERRDKISADFKPDSKDYHDRVRELRNELVRFKDTMDVEREDLMIEKADRTVAFYNTICKVVEAVAHEDGFDVVLFKSEPNLNSARSADELLGMITDRKIVYNSSRADITAKVLQRLDATFVAPASLAPTTTPAATPKP